jgi:hypothetical protein
LVSNTSFATVTIINEEVTPPDPTNSVTPLVNFDLVTIIPAPSQNIIINTMEQWDIISLLYLVTIISNNGSGNATVEVTPVNYTDLAAGNYSNFDVVIGSHIYCYCKLNRY